MIQIGNSTYKEYDIVLVETDKAEKSLILYQDIGKKTLKYEETYLTQAYLRNMYAKSYHLYIISDDKIKDDDFFVNMTTNNIHKCHSVSKNIHSDLNGGKYHGKWESKKIITTTDELILKTSKSINKEQFPDILLPQLPQDFIINYINKYNKNNIITKVLLEVVKYIGGTVDNGWEEYRLKLNNNNVIIGVLDTIPVLVQQLLDKKAEASNKIDLDAYASGLMDMYNALNISQNDDIKLKQLVELLRKANVRQYTCMNDFGYSQLERDIVNLFK